MAKIVKREHRDSDELNKSKVVKKTNSVNDVKIVKKKSEVKEDKEITPVKKVDEVKEVKSVKEVVETKEVKPVKEIHEVKENKEVKTQEEVKITKEDENVKKTTKRKKGGFKKFLSFLFVVILIAGCGFAVWKFAFNKEEKVKQEIKEIDNLKDYGYSLTDNDSEYFKTEFEELKKLINGKEMDEETYVTQVAKMFVIDLYSLNTKVNKYDIGGLEYYHVNKKDMYELKVMDTLYSIVLDNTFGDREQELPEVSGVEVSSVKESTYKLGDKKVDSYEVRLAITYVKDMGYDKDVTVTLVQENDSNRWSVVESNVNKK